MSINKDTFLSLCFLVFFISCDLTSNQEAISKFKNIVEKDSLLFNEYIYLSKLIEVDSVNYTIRKTKAGSVSVEESNFGGKFLNNNGLNSDYYKNIL